MMYFTLCTCFMQQKLADAYNMGRNLVSLFYACLHVCALCSFLDQKSVPGKVKKKTRQAREWK